MLRSLALALALSGCATTQSATPVRDPAVEFINSRAAGTPYRQKFSGRGDARIHYVVAGSGPKIVFVHGFPSFWYSWSAQMEAFRACRTVIAIDAPGANLSGRPTSDEAYQIASLARRLDQFIADVAPGEQITLVGHDWGGVLAWSYAQWRPQRLDRLAAFSAPPFGLFLELAATDPEQQARSGYMQRFRALDHQAVTARRLDETLWRTAYADMVTRGVLSAEEGALYRQALSPAAVNAGMAWYRANIPPFESIELNRDAWPGRDAATAVPVLLVEGEQDQTFVSGMAAKARAHAAALTTVTLKDVGHWTPFEDPAAANAALGRFLGLPGGRCPATK